MAEALDTRAALAAERDAEFFPINKLPKELLVSVFAAAEDPFWVRYTMPLVCKGWAELYRSKDASPLHDTLEVDFCEAVEIATEENNPVVHASRVISWAQRRAGSVCKLRLVFFDEGDEDDGGNLKDFSPKDLGKLVAVVGPSLTEIVVRFDGSNGRYEKQLWRSLRDHVAPAGRLRSLVLEGIEASILESDVGPLAQLAGSLEELELHTFAAELDYGPAFQDSEMGLSGFPEALCALTELRRLVLDGHQQVTALPAEISSLKKLEELDLVFCNLSSLPKELGELSALTMLDLWRNFNFGKAPEVDEHLFVRRTPLPAGEALPAELGKLKSLQYLDLSYCELYTIPAFLGELESLEVLKLYLNYDLQIDAPLDFLLEGCPRLRLVSLGKDEGVWVRNRDGSVVPPYTPESLAHLEAFTSKLLAKTPSAEVSAPTY